MRPIIKVQKGISEINKLRTKNQTLRIKYEGIKKLLEKKDKEIEKLQEENLLLRASESMSKLAEDYGYKVEVERLNKILDEFCEYLNKVIETSAEQERITCSFVLKYLQELKGGNEE